MHQYLVDHALRNVWCSPRQDNQFVLAPQRISSYNGELNVALIMGSTVELPVPKIFTHLFQIGQVDPASIKMLQEVPFWRTRKWFKFSQAVNHQNLEIMIHNADGVLLPRSETYYMFTEENALIFAIPQLPTVKIDYRHDQIYFRFYLNNYYVSGQNTSGYKLETGSFKPRNNEEILQMERFLADKRNLPGYLRIVQNGLLVDKAQLGDIAIADIVEWTYDPSVRQIIDWKLTDLHQFRSKLDNVYKFLLTYPGTVQPGIDFQDDIDIFVYAKNQFGFIRGLYLNRNQEYNHRMVTHRDYSVASEAVIKLRDKTCEAIGLETPDSSTVFVKAIIRRGGVRRSLVFENQRVFELYKLNPETRMRALIGIDSTVPEWNCENLEASSYTELMRAPYREVDVGLVEKAYGYNACSVVLANSPLKAVLENNGPKVKLPPGLAVNSTIYEFNAQGVLLGYRHHANDDDYDATYPETRLVEGIVGTPSQTLDAYYGQDNILVPTSGFSYRVYRCFLYGGVPNNQWEDITDTNEYRVENGKIRWKMGGRDHWLMVRTDANVLCYDVDIRENDGLLNFSLSERRTENNVDTLHPLTVPMAQLDIWMYNYKLVRDLDYYVEFPQVFITNKTFRKQPAETALQKLHVRMYGLPGKDMQLDPLEDRGWVINGSLSNNKRFDLRDDKVLQINVGGRTFHRSDLKFGEDRPGQNLLSRLNGLPYEIKDTIVPMRGRTDSDTYAMRKKSLEIDQRVSDYMSLKFGEMESNELSAIVSRYPVVSPFISHILHLVRFGRIDLPEDRHVNDLQVRELCGPYENLLKFDPMLLENKPDPRFAYIVPHGYSYPITLNFIQYRFIESVVRLYGKDLVSISEYINITS